jgi:hypothetical protein
LLNAPQQLTSGQGDNKQYGFVIPRSTSTAVKFLVHLLGAATTRGSGDTLEPKFNDPKVMQAARKVVDLLRNSTPHARLDDYAASGQNTDYGLLTGDARAGMWFAWGLYAYGQDRPQFTMAMAPPIDYYWFYRAIDHALQGKNLDQELAQAQALTEQYVACVRAGGQRETCDQQVDPNYGHS